MPQCLYKAYAFSNMISLPYLQPILFLSIKLLCLQASTLPNDTDQLSLLIFKQGITDPYGVFNSWNDSVPFCNWFGITCSSRHHRVTSMVLPHQNLLGSISPYIGNLSFLRLIDLQNNSFHGVIPQEIGRLFRLQHFILGNNDIGGQIPATIANCSQLMEIRLGNNKISGTIPAEIGFLPKLQILNLWRNNLKGLLPSSLGNISTLQILYVGDNKIEGSIPDEMGKLASLTYLGMQSNKLLGLIPPSIFNITSLSMISFAVNNFYGTLPDNLCLTLPNLKEFSFAVNIFSGTIPKSISNCSHLKIFDMSNNRFVGQVPADLGNLQNLSWLNLENNSLGSNSTDDLTFITSLTNCSNLQILAYGINLFGGTLPSSFANLSTQLTEVYMGKNQISGTIPDGLDNLVNLIGLGMENNLFTGTIPLYFGKLQSLQMLYLAQNRFSGEIPTSFGNLTELIELNLFDNKLEGSIPSSLGKFQMLSYISLARNRLTGGIPPQILLLSSLSKGLDLSENMLTGNLPPEVGKLVNLNLLVIKDTNLSGEIPETIGECESLEFLVLQGNSFEGTIPSSLASLRGLQELDLSRNNLSGQIPEDLQGLPFLQSLNLSFNNLEGEVPSGGVFKNASSVLLLGNTKICGGVPELRLPKCPSKTTSKHKSFNSKLAVIIGCVAILVLLMPTFLYLYLKRSSKRKSFPSVPIGEYFVKVSYGDLYRATRGFSPDNLLGCGGFGSVYKGSLFQIEQPVAVKVINLEKKDATKSFETECRILRNIRHRNLVKILTYCSSIDYKGNEFKALVYEFMENGSLENWLHPRFTHKDDSTNLSILQRLNIAIDIASALHYLHDLGETPIIHCDLKPSNILLDNDMVAHLSDFGLARIFLTSNDPTQSQTSTTMNRGTVGYAAPEYGTASAASREGDAYSYGILVLEMFTGKRPTDEMFKDALNLHDFVKAALPGRLPQIIDPSILAGGAAVEDEEPGQYDDNGIVEEEVIDDEKSRQMKSNMQKCLRSILAIGLACSVESPKDRMRMMDVTKKLQLVKTDFVGTHQASP